MEITTEKKPSLTIELPYNHDQDKGDDVYTVMVKVSIRGVEAEVPLIKLLREEAERINDYKKNKLKNSHEDNNETLDGSRLKYLLKESGEGAVLSWLRYIARELDSERTAKAQRGMIERGEVTEEQLDDALHDESSIDYIPYDYWVHECS